jgi:ferredoxin
MADMKTALANLGFTPQSVHAETFNGGESLNPGIVGGALRAPHVPEGDTGTGPLVSFARSGVAAHWNPSVYESILELAEACDVPVRWSCRSGVCHNCESGLVSGAVVHEPDPLDPPASGNLLICCARPQGDVAIDI